jgi:hypothetical protein
LAQRTDTELVALYEHRGNGSVVMADGMRKHIADCYKGTQSCWSRRQNVVCFFLLENRAFELVETQSQRLCRYKELVIPLEHTDSRYVETKQIIL